MDFVGPLPLSEGFDFLWVVICRLTSMVHLIPVRTTIRATELAWLFIKEIVRLHGLPDDIVSDRDPRFISKFWKEVHRVLGTRLLMSTSFHPQTDGATERANRSVNQILRALIKPDQSDWVQQTPMVEFAINSSISRSSGFAPFELNSGHLPRMVKALPTGDGEALPGVQQFAQYALDNLIKAHDAIIDSRVQQTYHANKKRRSEDDKRGEQDPLKAGDLVYLSTENLNLPTKRARKLVPKFIGPYEIIDGDSRTSAYTLKLPEDLQKRGIHPKFHVSLLRRHEPNDTEVFPHRDTKVFYDLGTSDETEWLVDEILGHEWHGDSVLFKVKWNVGGETWEPIEIVEDLEALDNYYDLFGITHWQALPKNNKAPSKRQGKRTTSKRA